MGVYIDLSNIHNQRPEERKETSCACRAPFHEKEDVAVLILRREAKQSL